MSAQVTASTKDLPSTDDLSRQIETLRAELARISTTAAENVAEGVSTARHKIGQTGRDARATVTDTVLEHPLAAVGVAAGFGFLLGMIMRKG